MKQVRLADKVFCLVAAVLFATACSAPYVQEEDQASELAYAPLNRSGWDVCSMEEQGVDRRGVAKLYDDATELDNLYGLLIVKDGCIVAEQYFNGRSVDSRWPRASVAKSYTSALVGIAIEEGFIASVEEKMYTYFPEFAEQFDDPRKRDITIQQMLQMRSGFPWEEMTPPYLDRLFSSNDWLPHVVDFPLTSDPGSEFGYSNLTAHLLSIIVTEASGDGLMKFGQAHLFRPLGVQVGSWPYDARGYTYGSGDIAFSARDMARFGQLHLDGGVHDGKQLIPAQWVADSLQVYSEGIYGGRIGSYFREMSYGYLWWSARAGSNNFNYAWGHGGNLIILLHDLDMVVVTTADPLLGQFGEAAWKKERAVIDLVGKYIASLPRVS